jgi:phosphohistidine swiveling domain-containing protein
MVHYVRSLKSRAALLEHVAGGKGAGLSRLCRQGFNVPPGFVITPAAFRDFLADFEIEVLVQRREWAESDLERIREMLMACRIPDRLARPIRRAYRKLGGDRVAIRSSLMGEDTALSSFAGQLDTVLNVQGEKEVLQSVRRCWSSVFNWRLLNYLSEHEARSSDTLLESFCMAVVVQRMVDAQAAGVAFSADPVTGQRCVVIEAVRGLGEALVQGLVEPDRYFVDARGILSEAKPANAEAPVLQEGQVLQLAEIVREVASRFKDPQDIEWAWDGTDFYLLQCRPITSLVGRRVYSNKMVSDMSPGLIKPLVYSTKTAAMAKNVFGRMFTELIGPNDIDFTPLAARIRSRIYTDITMLGELFERAGMPANFFQMISRDERSDFRRPPLTLKTLRAMFRLFRFAWRQARPADKINAFIERHHRELESYRQADWSSVTPQELLAQFDQLMRLHGETQWFILIGSTNMMVRNRLLNRLVSQHAEDVVPSDLIRGLIGLKGLEPNNELRELAAQARALGDEIQHLLIEKDGQTIRAALSKSAEGRALLGEVDAFMDRYGFLSANGTDFTGTPWVESPTLIWHAIGRAAVKPMESVTQNVEALREEARRRVHACLSWGKRLFFDRLLASTITYIDVRERTSLLMSEEGYQMRRLFLALADHLVARGDLDERDDIFYLTYDELWQFVEGKFGADTAREKVSSQKAEMEADAQIDLPETICGDYVPTQPIQPAESQECLVGIRGSSGLAQGYARVVLDPADAPVALSRDDILVVPFTDVGWTPLFSGIGAIVAETGGQLSHTSIVAREYGLPAVVSVRKATRLICDGQPVTVDGDRGRVYLDHVLSF